MKQSLQNKFNVLGALLVMFFLLMLPMFTQVKDDTRSSMREWKTTAGAKWTNELVKSLKPEDLENTQVEDSWNDYVNEQQEANPDCPACNPDDDADMDGMSNKDEVEAGRNPLCNEDELSHEACQNADPNNLTEPDDVLERLPVILLNETWNSNGCTGGIGGPFGCQSYSFEVNQTFQQLVAYLNVTNFQGVQPWTVTIDGDWEQTGDWTDNARPQMYNGYGHPTGTALMQAPEEGTYSANLDVTGATSGRWEIIVYGVR